jgi:hypothetical protein
MSLAPGSRLGHYEIVSPLGAGGMGEVYRARDTQLDRDVAIKILPELFATDSDRLARFSREAKTLATLNHPHIAQIYGLEGGRALVMELVEGPTLADRIGRGPISVDEAIAIAKQIAEALEAAHEAGVIHRDVKPANIKIRPDGTVKVLDFGLAKATEGSGGAGKSGGEQLLNSPTITSPAMTAAGIIMGTAAYMSPEQARGQYVDKRADIWAFGCVLYEMLTGRSPFQGATVTDVIAAVIKTEPDWQALNAPPHLRSLIARCLQKDPRQRLRDIGDARIELSAPHTIDRPDQTAPSRSAAFWRAIAVAALAIGVAAGAMWPRAASTPATATTAEQWNGSRLGGPAIVLNPRVSPDGQLLAFATVVDGLTQVAVMKPGSGNWTVLTRDRTQGLVFSVSWSPDSSRIYYDRTLDGPRGVYSVPALGGVERLVYEQASGAEPLPDGSLILLRINADRLHQLHRYWPATGKLEALPGVLPVADAESQLRQLPGGRSLVFIGRALEGKDRSQGLYEIDLESKRLLRLDTGMPEFTRGLSSRPILTINPQSGAILVAMRDGSLFRVFTVPRNGAAPIRTSLMFPMAAMIDIDKDGALYASLNTRPAEILRLGPSTGTVERLGSGPSISNSGIAPLADGRFLIPSNTGDRRRVLVLSPGSEPTPLVETEEDTRPPMTAVGDRHAGVVIGSGDKTDIAVVAVDTGRIIERFPAPPGLTSLAASPDGQTLYAAAGGSISALPRGGGTPTVLGAGDSITVDPASGDLVVKLDEQAKFRLVRIHKSSGAAQPIPFGGTFAMIFNPLMPGAIRNNQLVLPLSSVDSWDYHAGLLDLASGKVQRLAANYATDFHYLTRAADGTPIGVGLGFQTTLWKFVVAKER